MGEIMTFRIPSWKTFLKTGQEVTETLPLAKNLKQREITLEMLTMEI
jgi:hypothetical protein